MELTIGQSIQGFTLNRVRDLKDSDGTLYEFTHDKTHAQLCWMKNGEENKTFSIAFKTTPEDNTGVFHILEHSVLNGSDRYPVKEPFVELLKSSLNTFLNAITYDDKTMYPVSSRDHTDFKNLMSVYLDAVFHPAIYHQPNIFYQEGWHYEIRKPEDEPIYKGVVLNEMKGAFSSVDETLITTLNRTLFPDNCYQYVSGGHPGAITDLSYETFIETHKRFYHPSNSRIWLDGEIELEDTLSVIDSYLAQYEASNLCFDIPYQEATPSSTTQYEYEISSEEEEEGRTVVAMAKLFSHFDDVEKNIAFAALSNALTGSNEAPLKKPFLDAGVAEDIEFETYDGIQQPWAVFIIRNTDPDQIETCKQILKETIHSILEKGIDQEELVACLNQMEFHFHEKQEPSGVINAQDALSSWLYGGDPALYLELSDIYASLREKASQGYYEELLKEFFLEEEHTHTVIAIPSKTLGQTRLEAENAKLKQIKESWNDSISSYIEINQKLDAWQALADTKEQLDTLPKLKLEELDVTPKPDRYEESEHRHVPQLVYPSSKSGIVYLNLYFNTAGVTKELLPALGLFINLLGDLPTKNYSVAQLQKQVRQYLGTLSFSPVSYSLLENPESTLPMLAVRCSVLPHNVEKAKEIILEILQNTIFDPETIHPILKQSVQMVKQSIVSSGHAYASARVAAHTSADGFYREFTSGYTSGTFMIDFDNHYDERIADFTDLCQAFAENLFTASRLTVSITSKDNLPVVNSLIDSLPFGEGMRSQVHYPLLTSKKEAIAIPGTVGYSCFGTTLPHYYPEVHVLTHILTYAWLWNEVRVKGGAYGTGINANAKGTIAGYSYRDPNPKNALSAIQSCLHFAPEMQKEDFDLSSYIIGALASTMPLMSPGAKIATSDARYFSQISYEERCANRQNLIHADAEKLCAILQSYNDNLEKGYSCIVASKDILAQCEEDTEILPSLS